MRCPSLFSQGTQPETGPYPYSGVRKDQPGLDTRVVSSLKNLVMACQVVTDYFSNLFFLFQRGTQSRSFSAVSSRLSLVSNLTYPGLTNPFLFFSRHLTSKSLVLPNSNHVYTAPFPLPRSLSSSSSLSAFSHRLQTTKS